jgi:hypothetical protein
MRKFTLIEKLVIPIIGIILTIIVPFYIYIQEKKIISLKLIRITANNFAILENIERQISNAKLEISMDERKIDGMYSVWGALRNNGNTSIRPEDFVKPITVTVNRPWRIFLQNPTEKTEPIMEWERVNDQSYRILPTVFNPGDSATFNLYFLKFADDEFKNYDKKEPEINWSARIVNVKSLDFDMKEKDWFLSNPFDKFIFNYANNIFTTISLVGFQVYLFIFVSTGLFIMSTSIAKLANRISDLINIRDLFFLSIIMIMSMSTAEIIAYIARYSLLANELWGGCYILLAFHFLLLLYIAYPLLEPTLKRWKFF